MFSCFRNLLQSSRINVARLLASTSLTVAVPNESDDIPQSEKVNGVFVIPWMRDGFPGFLKALKWMATHKAPSPPKDPNIYPELQVLPLIKDNLLMEVPAGTMRCTWLGHASVLVQFDGVTVLTDPVLYGHCGPASFYPFGVPKFRPSPCKPEDLPPVDIIIISHDHYDHLDYQSIMAIIQLNGDNVLIFAPMGFKGYLEGWGCKRVKECDWGQEVLYSRKKRTVITTEEATSDVTSSDVLTVVCLPSQHWCSRKGFDRNYRLWASWAVLGPTKRFYFAGDTGYCHVFKMIGEKYGEFDLAALPIGAYKPRDFMRFQHVCPEESVFIHRDVKARHSLAIHWGTFLLADDGLMDPLIDLNEVLMKHGVNSDDFLVLRSGESRLVN